jgi:multiple sugar transport system permease protein/raffinose/stachyose/melibiose transport system permease protein
VHLILLLGAILSIFPFLWMILSGFKPNSEILAYPPTVWPSRPTLENFRTALVEIHFARYFMNSLFLTVTQCVIVVYTSALYGYFLNKLRFRGRRFLFIMVIATLMVPWPVTLIPLYQVMVEIRWVGSYLSIIVPRIISSFGVFMMYQFLTTVPDELILSARIDGANEFALFNRIVFPLLQSASITLLLLTFLGAWDDFLWPYLMLDKVSTFTLQIGLAMFAGKDWSNYGAILAGASIAVLPTLAIYIAFQRYITTGIALSGLK